MAIFLFFIANIFFATRPLLSIYGFIKLLEFGFLIFYLANTIKNNLQLQQIAFLFSVSVLGESFLAIAQYVHQGSINGILYFLGERFFTGSTPGIANATINGELILRPYATFPHPNVLAGYLLVTMVFLWSFLLRTHRTFIKSLAIFSLMMSSIALLLTYSRVAIFLWALLVCLLFMRRVFQTAKTVRAKSSIAIGVVLISALISVIPVTHELYSRFSSTSLSEESVVQRTELLDSSWKLIQQHPFIGVGLDNFIPALSPLQRPLPMGLYLQPVHNIIVLETVETGLIGGGLFVWLQVVTILRLRKEQNGIKNSFFLLLAIVFLTGMFDHYWLTLQQGQLLFAIILGLCWTDLQKSS